MNYIPVCVVHGYKTHCNIIILRYICGKYPANGYFLATFWLLFRYFLGIFGYFLAFLGNNNDFPTSGSLYLYFINTGPQPKNRGLHARIKHPYGVMGMLG